VCAGHKYNFSCKLQVSIAIFVSLREQIFQNEGSELRRMEYFFMTLISCVVTNAPVSRLQPPCSFHESVSWIFHQLLNRSWNSSRQVRLWSTRASTVRLPAIEPAIVCRVYVNILQPTRSATLFLALFLLYPLYMLLCNQLQRINNLFDSDIQHYTWPRLDTWAIVDAPTIKTKCLIFNSVEQLVLLKKMNHED
jgi:hypothetical protein